MKITGAVYAAIAVATLPLFVCGLVSDPQPEVSSIQGQDQHQKPTPAGSTFDYTASAAIAPTESGSIYPIVGYKEVLPIAGTPRNFGLNQTWANLHEMGYMTIFMQPGSDTANYGMFKCQYFCNGAPTCVSFYGQFVGRGDENVQFLCTRFDDFIHPRLYVEDRNGSYFHAAGYNKLPNED